MPDVTVRGAGVAGLSVAYACACRGMRVAVVDPHGVAAGASGGIVGALAPHAPERWTETKAFQRDALLIASDWWAAVAQVGGGDPGYARTGRLQPIPDEAAMARAVERAEAAHGLWQGAATWAVVDAPGGWSPATPKVVHDTLSARLHPRRACRALADAVRALDGTVEPDAPDGGQVVHATGWAGLDATGSGTPIKGQAATLRLDRRDLPQLYVDGLHVVPHADGTVGVGSTSERSFGHPGTDALLDDVVARARAAVPDLAHAPVVERWAGLRPRARTRSPMVGRWPGRDRHWIANGGFKIGFAVAPLAAERLADAIAGGPLALPDAFDPALSLPGGRS
ncbi:NAD(P)/FAD-dependent oxidoreductase [Jannaschia sp. LMIT008]|uniref:NAD(P)/FAD-dependent oxidoreductase n=1 Tax=Jannaschia maritima TaxID=3032585 RepID=UPI0035AB8DDD